MDSAQNQPTIKTNYQTANGQTTAGYPPSTNDNQPVPANPQASEMPSVTPTISTPPASSSQNQGTASPPYAEQITNTENKINENPPENDYLSSSIINNQPVSTDYQTAHFQPAETPTQPVSPVNTLKNFSSYAEMPSSPPSEIPPPSAIAFSANPPPTSHHKLSLLMIMLFFLIGIAGFIGSLFFFNITNKPANVALRPQITPPVTIAPTVETPTPIPNPFASPTASYQNPFVTPTVSYTNPFGTYENPFAQATNSATADNTPYQNPFANLK